MPLDIILAKDHYLVQSGKSTYIQAIVDGWTKTIEKDLLWSAEKGSVDKSGKYTAPEIMDDDIDIVTVCCARDKSIEKRIAVEIVFTDSSAEFVRIGEIKEIGKDGRYAINIQCLNKKGIGHKCSIVVTDYDQGLASILPNTTKAKGRLPIRKWAPFQIQVKTSKMGFASIHLKPFTDKERKIHVRVKGSEVDREIYLKGPRKKIELRADAGFWKNATQNF